jgi:hypothetical protein
METHTDSTAFELWLADSPRLCAVEGPSGFRFDMTALLCCVDEPETPERESASRTFFEMRLAVGFDFVEDVRVAFTWTWAERGGSLKSSISSVSDDSDEFGMTGPQCFDDMAEREYSEDG